MPERQPPERTNNQPPDYIDADDPQARADDSPDSRPLAVDEATDQAERNPLLRVADIDTEQERGRPGRLGDPSRASADDIERGNPRRRDPSNPSP